MSRYIKINGKNIRVGYDFLKSSFYVTTLYSINGSEVLYTTYRDTVSQTRIVLNSLGVTVSDISDTSIASLKATMETLTSVSYTWEDTGAYIKTIQFNDYKDFALQIDCEKSKLFIRNSEVTYDLTVDESVDDVRVPYLCSFYATKIGLTITQTDMKYFYNLLVSYYTPKMYYVINPYEDNTPLTYSNICKSSNFDKSSPVDYSFTYNPFNDVYKTNLCSISSVDNVTNKVSVFGVSVSNWLTTDTLGIKNTETVLDTGIFSADGEYPITKLPLSGGNLYPCDITVEGNIPVSYTFPYISCYYMSAEGSIEEIDRNNNTIKLVNQVPSSIAVGDKIFVNGTSLTTTFETLSCDGKYTVIAIDNKTITVQETLSINFSGTGATITKEALLVNIKRISYEGENSNYMYTFSAPLVSLTAGAKLILRDTEYKQFGNIGTYVRWRGGLYNRLETSEMVSTSYEPTYPIAVRIRSTDFTLINITKSSLDNFPSGEFMLDTFTEAKSYIGTAGSTLIPAISDSTIGSFNADVSSSYAIETTTTGITSMSLLGLYSKVYEEN